MLKTALHLAYLEESIHEIVSETLTSLGSSPANPLLLDSLLELTNLSQTIALRRQSALQPPPANSLKLSHPQNPRPPRRASA